MKKVACYWMFLTLAAIILTDKIHCRFPPGSAANQRFYLYRWLAAVFAFITHRLHEVSLKPLYGLNGRSEGLHILA